MPEFWDLNTPGGAAKAIAAGFMDAPKEDPLREVATPAGEEGAGSPESEKTFMWRVIRYAEEHGWHWWHVTLAPMSPPGLPDLILWRDRIIWVELKARTGKLSKAQRDTLEQLQHARGEVYVWRPSSWRDIERVLGGTDHA